ncbi:MAG: hypothetical protein JSU61_12990 [Fidelibacterota bacterium]|nr:MAG: hypothetical protein JSU61_12990 [Candidatus Neomarinimicrobiota bacterium]
MARYPPSYTKNDQDPGIRQIRDRLMAAFMQLKPDPELTYCRNHMWFRQSSSQRWRSGLDSFAAKALVQVADVIFPPYRGTLSIGSPILWIHHIDCMVVLRCPMVGSALSPNWGVRDCPSLLLADPQGEGWLFEGDFQIGSDLTYLIPKTSLATWYQQEKEWLAREISMQLERQMEPNLGKTLSDGGSWVTDICSALGPMAHQNLLRRLINLN